MPRQARQCGTDAALEEVVYTRGKGSASENLHERRAGPTETDKPGGAGGSSPSEAGHPGGRHEPAVARGYWPRTAASRTAVGPGPGPCRYGPARTSGQDPGRPQCRPPGHRGPPRRRRLCGIKEARSQVPEKPPRRKAEADITDWMGPRAGITRGGGVGSRTEIGIEIRGGITWKR